MSVDFSDVPGADEIRSIVDERLKQAMRDEGAKVSVDFRGQQRHLYVISMPVAMLYFNPDTHRIRPLLALDPARHAKLESEPWSEESQEYLHFLLRLRPSNPDQTDPDYTALQDELDDNGQKDPGIITPEGILVDGNTRRAALLDLGVKNIQVGVLPDDTSRDDINNVELSLQLRKDKRREYSYVAYLIAINEQLSQGRREADVARDFNIKLPTLKRDLGVYETVKNAISRSRTQEGAVLREVDFEAHQEKLRELQRDYEKLKATNPDAAELLKEARLAMVILNFPKTSLRLAEQDFHDRYLNDRLPESLRPVAEAPTDVAIPGLPGVTVSNGSAAAMSAQALTDALLRAKATAQAEETLDAAAIEAAAKTISSARDSFEVAIRMAGRNAELVKRQTAVPDRLTDAAEYVNQCAKEFAEARAKRALDEEAFDDALIELKASLARLARQAGRTFEQPGDGVAWLLGATQES